MLWAGAATWDLWLSLNLVHTDSLKGPELPQLSGGHNDGASFLNCLESGLGIPCEALQMCSWQCVVSFSHTRASLGPGRPQFLGGLAEAPLPHCSCGDGFPQARGD